MNHYYHKDCIKLWFNKDVSFKKTSPVIEFISNLPSTLPGFELKVEKTPFISFRSKPTPEALIITVSLSSSLEKRLSE